MRKHFALLEPIFVAACVTPAASDSRAPEGSAVALGQAVQVGELVATPREVVEDSRCPENARCVWAGRLIVSTRIDGPDWRETLPLTLGQAHAAHGTSITLVSGLPERQAGGSTLSSSYRFVFEGGR